MNDRENQIEELAKVLYGRYCGEDKCGKCKMPNCDSYVIAKTLYNAGYRKARPLGWKVYTDSTMYSWTKDELIEQIRILEHNWNAAEERLDQQAKNFDMLEKQVVKEFAERLKEYARACQASGYDGIGENDIDELVEEYLK